MALEMDAVVAPMLNLAATVGLIIFTVALVAGTYWFVTYLKKYNTPVWIFYNDPLGNLKIKKDKGGVFTSGQSKKKLFFLRGARVGLQPDKVPYVEIIKHGMFSDIMTKMVFIYQHGLKNYAYINPVIGNPNMMLTVMEEDLNWYLHDKVVYGNMIKKENLLLQLLPIIGFVVSAIFIIILIMTVLKKFDVLKEVSANLLEASKELAKVRMSSAVIQ